MYSVLTLHLQLLHHINDDLQSHLLLFPIYLQGFTVYLQYIYSDLHYITFTLYLQHIYCIFAIYSQLFAEYL
jgi:hypothetical protein